MGIPVRLVLLLVIVYYHYKINFILLWDLFLHCFYSYQFSIVSTELARELRIHVYGFEIAVSILSLALSILIQYTKLAQIKFQTTISNKLFTKFSQS